MTDSNLRPLPIKFQFTKDDKTLDKLPDLILGAGVFNYQYHEEPHKLPAAAILSRAFDLGIRALDTSSYYGPSEEIVGTALASIREAYPRDSYYICTKAGRVAENVFDYAPASIRRSVLRSLERLHTDYLDVIYLHDVEFVETQAALDAIAELFKLKAEGRVKYVGLSGFPIDYVYKLAVKILETLGNSLDLVLSYSNFCLQNTLLQSYTSKFYADAKLQVLINASPLSMGLLRKKGPHAFHPASPELKKAVADAAAYTESQGIDISTLAIRFSLSRWQGPTVIGLSSVTEVENAISSYWEAHQFKEKDQPIVDEVIKIFGDQYNKTWPSGIPHDL
ncbi:hypothetical protein D0Z03_002378 [Geotrichum reessii]|nr:hypothetical protein D0Z03_002378 [Galactomyces reessii]